MESKGTELNVPVTEDDRIVCQCGSTQFVKVFAAYLVKSPLIGQRPNLVSKPTGLSCRQCSLPVTLDNVKRMGDLKHENDLGGNQTSKA